MKKQLIVLSLCLSVSTFVFSQITSIKTKPISFEMFGNGLMVDKETDKIWLLIKSDNQFEEKRVELGLGYNPLEAIQSLQNIKATMNTPKTTFEIEGYSFYVVDSNAIAILNAGKLEGTAGHYYFRIAEIDKAILDIIEKYDVKIGSLQVMVLSARDEFLSINLCFPKFNIHNQLTLFPSNSKTKLLSYINVKDGCLLTPEQMQIISACITKGIIKHSSNAQFYNRYISADDSILGNTKRLECNYVHYNGKFFLFPSGGLNVNYDPVLNWGISECTRADGEKVKKEHFYLKVVARTNKYDFDSNSRLIFTLSDGTEVVLDQILSDEVKIVDESYWIQATHISQFGTYARFFLNQEAKTIFLSTPLEVVKVTIVFAKGEIKEYELSGKQISRFSEKIKNSYMESIEAYKKSKK